LFNVDTLIRSVGSCSCLLHSYSCHHWQDDRLYDDSMTG